MCVALFCVTTGYSKHLLQPKMQCVCVNLLKLVKLRAQDSAFKLFSVKTHMYLLSMSSLLMLHTRELKTASGERVLAQICEKIW